MDPILMEKTLAREGCTLHYWVSTAAGGPWLMLLHGAGTDHRTFQAQYHALKERYNLIAMDTRGAGLSRLMGGELTIGLMVDDALAVMDKEGITKVSLIGHSLGGNLAQEIVYRHRDRVHALVFIGCTCNTMMLTKLERFAVWLSPAIFAVYPEKMLIQKSAAVSTIKAEVRAYLEEALGMVGKKNFMRIMGVGTNGCLHHLEDYRIDKPILLMCGESDSTGNIKKCAPLWAKREPQCEFHMIKDAGHCANMDNPDEVNRLLTGFLNRQYEPGEMKE